MRRTILRYVRITYEYFTALPQYRGLIFKTRKLSIINRQ